MAKHALDPAYHRVDVDEFLEMDFGGARAELEDGIIQMMSGGNEVHGRVAADIIMYFGPRLWDTGCRPYGSDFAARTEDRTVRFPGVSVYCDYPSAPANATKRLLGDPQIVLEALSRSTASHAQMVKLATYRELAGLREIVFVEPQSERVRLLARMPGGQWSDGWIERGDDIVLASLGLTIPHGEMIDAD